ncbi:hypothetical protein SALBM311S_08934 [Streptomyces alboniger]
MTSPPTTILTGSPSLAPLLVRGALLSPFKRPRPDADFPRTRLVLPGLRVDLARLAAYERVCGFATGDDALPPTYPHVLGFPLAMRLMSGRDFPLPLLGLVHTSIEITQRRAMTATGEYRFTVYVDELVPHRRGTEAAVVTEVRSADAGRSRDVGGPGNVGGTGNVGPAGDEVVWESRSTYLARHRTDGPAGSAASAIPVTSTGSAGSAAWATDRREPLPTVAEWRLAGDVGRRYGAASGDHNPIHLYALTARLFGFRRAIAHGMWTVARCLAAHGTPAAAVMRADFRAPVPLPGTVTYAAENGLFELRAADGRTHVTGGVYPLVSERSRAVTRGAPPSGSPGPPTRSSSGSPPPAGP